MTTLRARVERGRLVLDEPTDLPEGTELNLIVADEWDDLDDEERTALHRAISRGIAELRDGHRVPAEDLLQELNDIPDR